MTFETFEKLVASLSDKTEYVIPKKLSMLKYENQIIILLSFLKKIYQQWKWKKSEILNNRPAYWELSILGLSKMSMHEFWFDYVKPKYGEKVKLC